MTVPSLLILGTDVVLAATPATPVQLAHACIAAGYDAVIPATWGDELIAERTLERLRTADSPLVQCSCPLVSRRMAEHGASIAPMLLSFVPPPVATAEYLRVVYAPTRLHLTFAGGCPAARHESIDLWLSAQELMSALAERGITVSTQPTEFDSVIPPDRRRFFSEPGGVPTRSALHHLAEAVELHEIGAENVVGDLAQHLLSGGRTLLDVAPALGCSCSGAVGSERSEVARARVRASEPPRAFAPVVDHAVPLELDRALPFAELPFAETTHASRSESGAAPQPAPQQFLPDLAPSLPSRPQILPTPLSIPPMSASESPVAVETAVRRTPQVSSRAVLGTMPHARTDAGRQLPRAYVARRRSSPRGLRESSVRRAEPGAALEDRGRRRRWVLGAAVIGAGLMLGWLLRLVL